MTPQFILWGGTGQAKVLHEALMWSGLAVVLIVDNRGLPSPLPHIPIVKGLSGLENWLRKHTGMPLAGLAAMGGNNGKDRLIVMDYFQKFNIVNYTLVHERAFVAKDARIGEGSQILAQGAVCTHTVLARGVIVNTSASIDHDCYVEDGVHIAPGAKIAGEVTIGRCAFIGTGATVLPGIHIGEQAIVGAGAVVTKNVLPGAVIVGNPARPLNQG